ncbi:MAG: hypothetical protein AB1715_06830 [Acidobacteriota bacterium]
MYRFEGNLLKNLFLAPNRLEIHGLENKIEEGPCLIVCNHSGAAKDVAVIYRIFERMVFYCAMYYLFDRDTLSREIRVNYMRQLVPAKLPRAIVDLVLTPIRETFAWYVASRLTEIGTLPFKAEHLPREGRAMDHENIRELIQAYLLAGRAVVLMQADTVRRSTYHPYVSRFKRGAASIAYELFQRKESLEVPVTPISIYGAEGLLTIGKQIVARVGEPMTIKPFLDRPEPVESFTAALEKRVADLIRPDVEKYGMPKRKFARHVRRKLYREE